MATRIMIQLFCFVQVKGSDCNEHLRWSLYHKKRNLYGNEDKLKFPTFRMLSVSEYQAGTFSTCQKVLSEIFYWIEVI